MSVPSQGWDRRRFLAQTAALLGAGVTAACDASPLSPLLDRTEDPRIGADGSATADAVGTIHLLANESGLFPGRGPFVVGLLVTDEPDVHEEALAALRAAHNYFTELRYSSTDRFKQAYAEAALDHFFASDHLHFAALAATASRSAGGLDATALYEELLRSLGGNGAQIVLRMEHRFLDPAPDAALEGRLEGIDSVSVEFMNSFESNLLQLGDLLTGSIQGDLDRKAKGRSNPRGRSLGNNVKDRLIASLKERLNVQRLSHPSLAKRQKFNVEVVHPPF
jgi:hypothetical protein